MPDNARRRACKRKTNVQDDKVTSAVEKSETPVGNLKPGIQHFCGVVGNLGNLTAIIPRARGQISGIQIWAFSKTARAERFPKFPIFIQTS